MAGDKIMVEVLPDGTIKISTDAVSKANHTNAENMLRAIVTEAGGTPTRTRRGNVHAHVHEHDGHFHEH